MIALTTLLPSLFLAAGALALRSPHRMPRRAGRLIGLAAPGLAMLASVFLIWLVVQPQHGQLRLVLSPWSRSAFQVSPALDVDLLAAVFSTFVSALALGALLLRGTGTDSDGASVLWVAAAAALFTAAGRAPLGLVVGWLALDLAIVLGLQAGRWALLAGQVGLLCAVLGLSALPPGTDFLSRSAVASATPTVRFWLMMAGMIRMGLYPFWWTVPPSRPYNLWASVTTRLAPTLCGLYLVVRAAEITPYGQGLNTVSLLPPLLAIVAGALLAWLANDRASALDWTAVHQAGLVYMAAAMGGPMGMYPAFVMLLGLVLSYAVLYGAIAHSGPPSARLAARLAAASAIGLPPTLGFTGRWLLYRELLNYRLAGVLMLTGVASAVAAASLVGAVAKPGSATPLRKPFGYMLLAASALVLVLGLGFELIRPALTHMSAGYEPQLPWADIATTVLEPGSSTRGLQVFFVILLPALAAWPLSAWRARTESPEERLARRRRTRAVLLNDLLAGMATVLLHLGAFLQRATGRHQGRQDMAWTLLAVVAVGGALFSVAVRTDLPLPIPAPLAPLLLLAATAVAAVMLLGRTSLPMLASLGCAYVFSAALLALVAGLAPGEAAGGAPSVVATIKLMAGMLVVGVLAISISQAPLDRRLAGAALQLRRFRPLEMASSGRVMPVLALAVAVVISYGVQVVNLPQEVLPDAVLQSALILAAGGVLTVVFAVSALHLACGVLMALVGFELVYARLDPGLLVTGGLAAMQLAFAIIASHFVGGGEMDALQHEP